MNSAAMIEIDLEIQLDCKNLSTAMIEIDLNFN